MATVLTCDPSSVFAFHATHSRILRSGGSIARNPQPGLLPGLASVNWTRHSVLARAAAGNSTPLNPALDQ